jgi:hypothetical protein
MSESWNARKALIKKYSGKGTRSFSDHANEASRTKRSWLQEVKRKQAGKRVKGRIKMKRRGSVRFRTRG